MSLKLTGFMGLNTFFRMSSTVIFLLILLFLLGLDCTGMIIFRDCLTRSE
jgi:hypothetical protein